MRRYILTILLVILSIFLVACGTQSESNVSTQTPSLDLDSVQTILPTSDPADIETLAQLADEETLALGEQVYRTSCASCHGLNGEGQFPDAPMQPDITGRIGAPPHDDTGHTWHHPDDLLYEIIRDGGMGDPDMFYTMPAMGELLTDEEVIAVVEYIRTMWTEEQRRIQAQRTLANRQQD